MIEKMSMTVPITQDLLDDGPFLEEALALAIHDKSRKERYRHVYRRGYREALEDIRAGRLVLRDGFYRVGHL